MMAFSNVAEPTQIRIESTSGSLPKDPSQVHQSWHELAVTRQKVSTTAFRGLTRVWLKRCLARGLSALGYSIVPHKKIEGSSSRFVDESHHRFYKFPWCIGRDQMDYMVSRGLLPSHLVLELGCGSLRAGIWLIRYLENGNYFGVDAHLESLEAATRYEIPLHGLEEKNPRFLLSHQFELSHFGVNFEWILAFSFFMHLDSQNQELALRNMRSCLKPEGRVVLSHRLPLTEKKLRNEFGLVVTHVEARSSRFVDENIKWFELTLSNKP
jgi:SAM-dependent methyltransferase